MSAPVLWFTGRPGSGKHTVADEVVAGLRTRRVPVELLDHAILETEIGPTADPAQRLRYLAALLQRHGVVSVVISSAADGPAADAARATIPGLIEVFVDTPREICIHRVGQRAAMDFEAPVAPELRVVTHDREPLASAAQVLSLLDTIDLTGSAGDTAGRPWASAGK
ncbi:MAG: adenylyl-sulfate kinase [Acidimicrobiia bacterium]